MSYAKSFMIIYHQVSLGIIIRPYYTKIVYYKKRGIGWKTERRDEDEMKKLM